MLCLETSHYWEWSWPQKLIHWKSWARIWEDSNDLQKWIWENGETNLVKRALIPRQKETWKISIKTKVTKKLRRSQTFFGIELESKYGGQDKRIWANRSVIINQPATYGRSWFW